MTTTPSPEALQAEERIRLRYFYRRCHHLPSIFFSDEIADIIDEAFAEKIRGALKAPQCHPNPDASPDHALGDLQAGFDAWFLQLVPALQNGAIYMPVSYRAGYLIALRDTWEKLRPLPPQEQTP